MKEHIYYENKLTRPTGVLLFLFTLAFIFLNVIACTNGPVNTTSTNLNTSIDTAQSTEPKSASGISAKIKKMTDSSGKWQIEVSWTNDTNVSYYSLQSGESSKSYTNTFQKIDNPFIIKNIAPNSSQYFVIISNFNINNSILTVASNEYSVKIPLDDYTKKPGSFVASLNQSTTEIGKYTLTWTEPTDDGASFYTIYKGITSGSYPDLVTYLPDVRSRTFEGTLPAGTASTYFLIIAVNSKGSTNSNEVKYEYTASSSSTLTSTSTSTTQIIPGDFSVTTTPKPESVTLNWTESSDAMTYVIQYGITPDSFPNILAPLPSSTTEYTVTNLTDGVLYYFNVIAVSADSNSKNANAVVSETPVALQQLLYRSLVLDNNPVAYWPLQELSGTNAADLSGHAFNGTYHGNVSFAQQTTVKNQSVLATSFSGVSSYVQIPDISYNNLTEGTISVWVNLNDITQGLILGKQYDNCCSMGVLSVGSYSSIFGNLQSGTQGVVYFHDMNYITPEEVHSNTIITTGTWYHLAVVFSAAGATVYINGVASGSETSRAFAIPDYTSVTETSIAAFATNYYQTLNGMVGGLAIFPTALSQSTIQALYDAGGTW